MKILEKLLEIKHNSDEKQVTPIILYYYDRLRDLTKHTMYDRAEQDALILTEQKYKR